MKRRYVGSCAVCALALSLAAAATAWAQDNVEPPWGIQNGDIFGRARSDQIPALFDANNQPVEVWRFDPLSVGGDRPGGWSGLVFDAAGNLYWRTTLGNNKLMSVAPDGTFRWMAHDPNGADFVFGPGWNSTSPIVGQQRVYALGAGDPIIAAFDKATGERIWVTTLPTEPSWTNNQQPTPILYNGKLYVLGQSDGVGANVHQVDADTGLVDWTTNIFLPFPVSGTMAFVPDAFGTGLHGLYFNTDSGSGSDGFGEVYGVKIDPTSGATLMWEAEGGKVARSHVIYNPATGHLYTPTWTDYGASLYVYDPVTGGPIRANYASQPAGGHGFYDVGMVDWDDQTIIAGGFDGRVGLYREDPNRTDPNAVIALSKPFTAWYGEFRVLGQLLKNADGDSILVSGTNSRCGDLGEDAAVVVLNLSQATTGPFEDGPMYVDDVEVLQGPDPNNLTPVFTEDFDALALGDLPGQNGWEDDRASPSGDGGPVQVVTDPTDPNNQVMVLDALGTNGGWQGVFHNFPDTTDNIVVIRWRQWRADTTDNVWPYFGDFVNDFSAAWTLGWDITGKYFAYHFDDPNGTGSVLQEAGQWETVEFVYDFVNFTVRLTITPESGPPKVGTLVPQFEFSIAGFGIQIEGTALSSNVNASDVEYHTGICADHGFTTRGGPLTGPDGKIYYFDTGTRELVALGTAGAPCPEDLNGDGQRDLSDLSVLLSNFGLAGGPADGDINGDGVVDLTDLAALLAVFGLPCP